MTRVEEHEDELVQVKVSGASACPHLAWAEGETVSIPARVADQLVGAGATAGLRVLDLSAAAPQIASGVAEALRLRRAFTTRKPGSSRLPFSYRRIPTPARLLIGGLLGRRGRRRLARPGFPDWPLDLSADFAADLSDAGALRDTDGETPVMLTHDLDSPEGLENALGLFADIEEQFGARAANFVVPCSWPHDHGRLQELSQRGHEIGVHGFDHANRTPFAAPEERRRRLEAARPFIERYGVKGYRAPSLVRTQALLEDLAALYVYDSSIPTSGGLFPTPDNGCASARPFKIGKLLELPISLPRDGSLRFLGYGPHEIVDMWKAATQRVRASGGMVVLLTHCEAQFSGNSTMLECYRRFLEFLVESGGYRFVLPREVAQVELDKP